MVELVVEEKVKIKEHMIDGLANALQRFIDMINGHNFGKTVIKVAKH